MLDSISFGAKFRTNSQILKYNSISKKYESCSAALVEIETQRKSDVSAVKKTAQDWGATSYANGIARILGLVYKRHVNSEKHSIYALTTQEKDFSELVPNKILGLIEVDNSQPVIKINYLQAIPTSKYPVKLRNYKGIGKSLVDFLKSFRKEITLRADYRAANFYEKQNFELADANTLNYRWTPER